MRGEDEQSESFFSYVDLETRVSKDHPLRTIRAIDGRTTRHAGYAVSQRIRKRIEEAFGWIKTIAGYEKTKFRGRGRVGWAFTFAAAAYNLVRLPKLMAASR
jgi:hypothetical protein